MQRARSDEVVVDIFGFNALQIGLPQCDFLRANRIPLRQTVSEAAGGNVLCELTALPFASHSTDLVVLPPMLEFSELNGTRKEEYFRAVRAGLDRDYLPMQSLFDLVIEKSLQISSEV